MNRKESLISLHRGLNTSTDSQEMEQYDDLGEYAEQFILKGCYERLLISTWKTSIENLAKSKPVFLKDIFERLVLKTMETQSREEVQFWNEVSRKFTQEAQKDFRELQPLYDALHSEATIEDSPKEKYLAKKSKKGSAAVAQPSEREKADTLVKEHRRKLAELRSMVNESNSRASASQSNIDFQSPENYKNSPDANESEDMAQGSDFRPQFAKRNGIQNQMTNFEINNSNVGEGLPSHIEISPQKGTSIQQNDSDMVRNTASNECSPDRLLLDIRASGQRVSSDWVKRLWNEIADVKNILLTQLQVSDGKPQEKSGSDFDRDLHTPFKEDIQKQKDLMFSDNKGSVLPSVITKTPPLQGVAVTPIKAGDVSQIVSHSASKKLDRILQTLEYYEKMRDADLHEWKMVAQMSLEQQQELLRLREQHLAHSAEREIAQKEVLERVTERKKKQEEEEKEEKAEEELLNKSTAEIMNEQNFREMMTKGQTVHNFLDMYNIMVRFLTAMVHLQLASVRFMTKIKKNLRGQPEEDFTALIRNFTKDMKKQMQIIDDRKNTRIDPTGLLCDSDQLANTLKLNKKQCRYMQKEFETLVTKLIGIAYPETKKTTSTLTKA